jgi:hypothetical protein
VLELNKSNIKSEIMALVLSLLIVWMATFTVAMLFSTVTGDIKELELGFILFAPLLFLITPFIVIAYSEIHILGIVLFAIVLIVLSKAFNSIFQLKILVPLLLVWCGYGLYCFGIIGNSY